MANKPKLFRRLVGGIMIAVGIILVAVVAVPPMITLNALRPRIEQTIAQRMGIDAKIRGNVRISLIGGATISARDIVVPDGVVAMTQFSIPLWSIFNLSAAPLSGDVIISGARLNVTRLVPVSFDNPIDIRDSWIEFYGKTYEIVNATIRGGQMRGMVRTDQHKYEIDYAGDEFIIKNRANDLLITGHLYSDGSARGKMRLDAADVNAWFEFSSPKIDTPVRLSMDFDWDGGYGFNFTHIQGDNFTGDIHLLPNGGRDIRLKAWDMNLDLGFLMQPSALFTNTVLDLDFSGNLTFAGHTFHHLGVMMRGGPDSVHIEKITADDIQISGGTITADGARDVFVKIPYDGMPATCLFSGTPNAWRCGNFTWGNISGSIDVDGDTFNIFVQSTDAAPDGIDIRQMTQKLGVQGKIVFQFSDIAGTINLDNNGIKSQLNFAHDRNIRWIGSQIAPISNAMRDDIGNFIWMGDVMEFTPHSGKWHLWMRGREFQLRGKNIFDLAQIPQPVFLRDMDYTISGIFNETNISNMRVTIGGHEFTGAMADQMITLDTNTLNIDDFINPEFVDNYPELEFMINSPIMTPFDWGLNLSLGADIVIYNGNAFQNFLYTLKPDRQTFSISDNDRGNMMAQITRQKKNYNISLVLDRFVISAPLLNPSMPLNIQDTMITATAEMTTSGQIAYDIHHNLRGNLDMTMIGGRLVGLGLDDFYAVAANLNTTNAEMILARALDGGQTRIKQIHIIGQYDDGNFETTRPMTITLPHVDARGQLAITDGLMLADIDLVLRGTAPMPAPIALQINGDTRTYSLSQIMIHFDSDYMRDFVRSHDKF